MRTKEVVKIVLEKLGIIYMKSVSIIVILGLLSQGIISVKIFAEDKLNIDRYRDDLMDIYFKMADREKEEREWRAVVEGGLDIVRRAVWEDGALRERMEAKIEEEKENGNEKSEEELRLELKEEIDRKRAEWEKEAEEDIHKEYGRRIKKQVDMIWSEVDESKLMRAFEEANVYLYEKDEEGNYVYDKYGYRKIKQLDENYLEDFANWDELILGVISSDIKEYESKLQEDMTRYRSEVINSGIGIDISRLDNYIEEEMKLREKNFEEERMFLYKNRRSNMRYERILYNRSLRKESEESSPDIIVDGIIVDTEKEISREMAKFKEAINLSMPEGSDEDIKKFDDIKKEIEEVFNDGMKKWQEAEKDFVASRIKWEQDAQNALKFGEKAWEEAFEKFEEAQDNWEKKLDNVIAEGVEVWENKERELRGNLVEMQGEEGTSTKGDLNRYLESLKEEWSSSSEGLISTINNGISMIKEADENISFFRKALKDAEKTGRTELVDVYKESLTKWEEYRTKFAGMVYRANEEYKNIMDSNLGNKGDLIPEELSEAKYQELLSLIKNGELKEYYVIEEVPEEIGIGSLEEGISGSELASFEKFMEEYYTKEGEVYKLKGNLKLSNKEKYLISYKLYEMGYREEIECKLDKGLFPEEISFNELNKLIKEEDSKGEIGIEYRKYYLIDEMPGEINVSNEIENNEEIKSLIEKYYVNTEGRYVKKDGVQIPEEKKYEIIEYLMSIGEEVGGINCRLGEMEIAGNIDFFNIYEDELYRSKGEELLKAQYEKEGDLYVLKEEISSKDKAEILKLLDYIGYSGFRYDNDLLENYKEAGILTDYDVAMIEASDAMNYWENRLAVINEVIEYSKNTKDESKEKTIEEYEKAEAELEEAKSFYESKLEELKGLSEIMDEKRGELESGSENLKIVGRELERAKSEYLKVKESLERKEKGLQASLSPFHSVYCNLLVEMKNREDSKRDYYELLMKKNSIDVIERHYTELTVLVRGDSENSIGLDGYREIKKSFLKEDGSEVRAEIAYDNEGVFNFEEVIEELNVVLGEVFKDGYNGEVKKYIEEIEEEKYDEATYNFKDINFRVSGLNIREAMMLLKTLRELKKSTGRKENDKRSEDEYREEIKGKVYELNRALLVLKDGATRDFELLISNIYYELGDESKANQFVENYISSIGKDVIKGDELYKSVLYERIKEELKAKGEEVNNNEIDTIVASCSITGSDVELILKEEFDIKVKEDEIISKARELLMKYEYNKSRIIESEGIIKEILEKINGIEGYEALLRMLEEVKNGFEAVYDKYINKTAGVSFKDVEKAKWLYDVLKGYVEDFKNFSYFTLCALGEEELSVEDKEEIEKNNRIMLGLMGELTLEKKDEKEMNEEEIRIYNMLKNKDLSEEVKKNIRDDLRKQNKKLLVILGKGTFSEEEREKVEKELEDIVKDYIKNIKEGGEQELANIGKDKGILKYLEEEGAGFAVSEYRYYEAKREYGKAIKELKKLEEEKAGKEEIEAKKKEVAILYEKVKFTGQSDYYQPKFLRGINTAYLEDNSELKKSEYINEIERSKSTAEGKGVYQYKNQKGEEVFKSINSIVNSDGNVSELKYFLENYFSIHRGELTPELENVLDNLYSSLINIKLAESLVSSKAEILAILDEIDLSRKSELKESLVEELDTERENIKGELVEINKRYLNICNKLGDLSILERNVGNIDGANGKELEILMDKSYEIITAIKDMDKIIADVSVYFDSLAAGGSLELEEGSKILKDIKKSQEKMREIKDKMAENIEKIKGEYIVNLGIDAGNYLVQKIEADEGINYLNYLSKNKAEVEESVKEYLASDRNIDIEKLSEGDKGIIYSEIETKFAKKYVGEVKYAFNMEELEEEKDAVVVSGVESEINKVLDSYTELTDESKKEIEKYIRSKVFKEVEERLEKELGIKLKSNIEEWYYAEELVKWLDKKFSEGQNNNDIEKLYNDFIIEQLDTKEYTNWSKIEWDGEANGNGKWVDVTRISGKAWEIKDYRIEINGVELVYLGDIKDIDEKINDDEKLNEVLNNMGIALDRRSGQLLIYNCEYKNNELSISEIKDGNIILRDSKTAIVESEKIDGDNIVKSAMDFYTSSLLTMIYNNVEKYVNTEKEGDNGKLEDIRKEIRNDGISSYMDEYSLSEYPIEYEQYVNGYIMKNYIDKMKEYKEYAAGDEYKKLSNEYNYKMGKNAEEIGKMSEEERKTYEEGLLNGIAGKNVNYSETEEMLGELLEVYTNEKKRLIEEITAMEKEIAETANENEKAIKEAKKKEKEDRVKEVEKSISKITENKDGLLDIESSYREYIGNESNNKELFNAKYLDKSKEEFSYYIKKYMLASREDKEFNKELGFLGIENSKFEELLEYGKAANLYYNVYDREEGGMDFEEFLNWEGSNIGSNEEKERILSIQEKYFKDAFEIKDNVKAALDAEYDVLNEVSEEINIDSFKKNYTDFKEGLVEIGKGYERIIKNKTDELSVIESKLAIVDTGNLGDMRNYLSYLSFSLDDSEEGEEGDEELCVSKKWDEVIGTTLEKDDYYLTGLNDGKEYNEITNAIAAGDINTLVGFVDKKVIDGKEYYLPMTANGSTIGQRTLGGKLLDIINDFNSDLVAVRTLLSEESEKDTGIVDGYLNKLISNYDYENGENKGTEELFKFKENPEYLYEVEDEALKNYFDEYGEVEDGEDYKDKVLNDYEEAGNKLNNNSGNITGLRSQLSYTGSIIENYKKDDAVLRTELTLVNEILGNRTTAFEEAEDSLKGVEDLFKEENGRYLDKSAELEEAYKEYMSKKKYFDVRKEIREYAESCFIDNGEKEEEGGNVTGVNPVAEDGEEAIYSEGSIGANMDLNAVRSRIEAKLEKTKDVYESLMDRYKDYKDRVNDLDKLVVSVTERITKEIFEGEILNKLSDEEKDQIKNYYKLSNDKKEYVLDANATTTERAVVIKIFEKAGYEDGNILTYSDVKEEYKESTLRYYRLLKTYNDLVGENRELKEKENELKNKEGEIESDSTMLTMTSFTEANMSNGEEFDDLLEHIIFREDGSIEYTDTKQNPYEYIPVSIDRSVFELRIKEKLEGQDRTDILYYYVEDAENNVYKLREGLNDSDKAKIRGLFGDEKSKYYKYYYREKYNEGFRKDYIEFVDFMSNQDANKLNKMFTVWSYKWLNDKQGEIGEQLNEVFGTDIETDYDSLYSYTELRDSANWLTAAGAVFINPLFCLAGVSMHGMIDDLEGNIENKYAADIANMSDEEKKWYEWYCNFYKSVERDGGGSSLISTFFENEIQKETELQKADLKNYWGSIMIGMGGVDCATGAALIAAGASACATIVGIPAGLVLIALGTGFCTKGGLEIGYGIGSNVAADNLRNDANLLGQNNYNVASNLFNNSNNYMNILASLEIVREALGKSDGYTDKYVMFAKLFSSLTGEDTGINYNTLRREDFGEWNDYEYLMNILKDYEGFTENGKKKYSSIELLKLAVEEAEKDKNEAKNNYYEVLGKLEKESKKKLGEYNEAYNEYIGIGFNEEESRELWKETYGVNTIEEKGNIKDKADELMFEDKDIPGIIDSSTFKEKILALVVNEGDKAFLESVYIEDVNRNYVLQNNLDKLELYRVGGLLRGIGFITDEESEEEENEESTEVGEKESNEEDPEKALEKAINDVFGDSGFDYSIVLQDSIEMHKEMYEGTKEISLFGKEKNKNKMEYMDSFGEGKDPNTIIPETDNNDNKYLYEKLVEDNYTDVNGNVSRSFIQERLYGIEESLKKADNGTEQSNLESRKAALERIRIELKNRIGDSASTCASWKEEDWKELEKELIEWSETSGSILNSDREIYVNYIREFVTYRETLLSDDMYCKESLSEYNKVIDLSYNRKMQQETKTQNNKWDMKIEQFLSEKKEWLDKMVAMKLRASQEWDNMFVEMKGEYKEWQKDMQKLVAEKTREWRDEHKELLDAKKEWVTAAKEAAENRTEEDIARFMNISGNIDSKINGIKSSGKWVDDFVVSTERLDKCISGFMNNPLLDSIMQVSDWSLNTIKFTDTTFSITDIKRNVTGSSGEIISDYNNSIENMSENIQKAANLRAYGSILDMVSSFKKQIYKTNTDTKDKTFGKMISEKGYTYNSGYWQREVKAGVTVFNGYDMELQGLEDYRDYEIPDYLLDFEVIQSEEELLGLDPAEAEMLVKLEMEHLQEDMKEIMPTLKKEDLKMDSSGRYIFEKADENELKAFGYEEYEDSINYHIGQSPKLNNDKVKDYLESYNEGKDDADKKDLAKLLNERSEKTSKDGGYTSDDYASMGIYSGIGEMGRIGGLLTYYDIMKSKYNSKLEGNYLQALEFWDTDLDNDGEQDDGTLRVSVGDVYNTTVMIVATVASAGALSGAGFALQAANAGINYGVNQLTSAFGTGLSTIGMDEEQKKKAWDQYWVGAGFNALTSAASLGIGELAGGWSKDLLKSGMDQMAVDSLMALTKGGLNMAMNEVSYIGQQAVLAGLWADGEKDFGTLFGDSLRSRYTAGWAMSSFGSLAIDACMPLLAGAMTDNSVIANSYDKDIWMKNGNSIRSGLYSAMKFFAGDSLGSLLKYGLNTASEYVDAGIKGKSLTLNQALYRGARRSGYTNFESLANKTKVLIEGFIAASGAHKYAVDMHGSIMNAVDSGGILNENSSLDKLNDEQKKSYASSLLSYIVAANTTTGANDEEKKKKAGMIMGILSEYLSGRRKNYFVRGAGYDGETIVIGEVTDEKTGAKIPIKATSLNLDLLNNPLLLAQILAYESGRDGTAQYTKNQQLDQIINAVEGGNALKISKMLAESLQGAFGANVFDGTKVEDILKMSDNMSGDIDLEKLFTNPEAFADAVKKNEFFRYALQNMDQSRDFFKVVERSDGTGFDIFWDNKMDLTYIDRNGNIIVLKLSDFLKGDDLAKVQGSYSNSFAFWFGLLPQDGKVGRDNALAQELFQYNGIVWNQEQGRYVKKENILMPAYNTLDMQLMLGQMFGEDITFMVQAEINSNPEGSKLESSDDLTKQMMVFLKNNLLRQALYRNVTNDKYAIGVSKFMDSIKTAYNLPRDPKDYWMILRYKDIKIDPKKLETEKEINERLAYNTNFLVQDEKNNVYATFVEPVDELYAVAMPGATISDLFSYVVSQCGLGTQGLSYSDLYKQNKVLQIKEMVGIGDFMAELLNRTFIKNGDIENWTSDQEKAYNHAWDLLDDFPVDAIVDNRTKEKEELYLQFDEWNMKRQEQVEFYNRNLSREAISQDRGVLGNLSHAFFRLSAGYSQSIDPVQRAYGNFTSGAIKFSTITAASLAFSTVAFGGGMAAAAEFASPATVGISSTLKSMLAGAAIGAGTEYGMQVTKNFIYRNNEGFFDNFTKDIDLGSIALWGTIGGVTGSFYNSLGIKEIFKPMLTGSLIGGGASYLYNVGTNISDPNHIGSVFAIDENQFDNVMFWTKTGGMAGPYAQQLGAYLLGVPGQNGLMLGTSTFATDLFAKYNAIKLGASTLFTGISTWASTTKVVYDFSKNLYPDANFSNLVSRIGAFGDIYGSYIGEGINSISTSLYLALPTIAKSAAVSGFFTYGTNVLENFAYQKDDIFTMSPDQTNEIYRDIAIGGIFGWGVSNMGGFDVYWDKYGKKAISKVLLSQAMRIGAYGIKNIGLEENSEGEMQWRQNWGTEEILYGLLKTTSDTLGSFQKDFLTWNLVALTKNPWKRLTEVTSWKQPLLVKNSVDAVIAGVFSSAIRHIDKPFNQFLGDLQSRAVTETPKQLLSIGLTNIFGYATLKDGSLAPRLSCGSVSEQLLVSLPIKVYLTLREENIDIFKTIGLANLWNSLINKNNNEGTELNIGIYNNDLYDFPFFDSTLLYNYYIDQYLYTQYKFILDDDFDY